VSAGVAVAGGALAGHAFGGTSGDIYGAVAKTVEIATYVTLAALWDA
jgi:cobalamin synthase